MPIISHSLPIHGAFAGMERIKMPGDCLSNNWILLPSQAAASAGFTFSCGDVSVRIEMGGKWPQFTIHNSQQQQANTTIFLLQGIRNLPQSRPSIRRTSSRRSTVSVAS